MPAKMAERPQCRPRTTRTYCNVIHLLEKDWNRSDINSHTYSPDKNAIFFLLPRGMWVESGWSVGQPVAETRAFVSWQELGLGPARIDWRSADPWDDPSFNDSDNRIKTSKIKDHCHQLDNKSLRVWSQSLSAALVISPLDSKLSQPGHLLFVSNKY